MKKTFSLMMVLLAVVVLFTQCKKEEEPVETTSIAGQITNSQTGMGLANALLSFYTPGSTTNPVFTVTTNSTGEYSTTTAVIGTYTLTITAANFFTLSVDNFVIAAGTVPGTATQLPPITMVQTLSNSLLRIVLTWGLTPYDLDSHLTGPIAGSQTTRFHVYWIDDEYNPTNAVTPIINLDVDETDSYGPETTTINSWTTGTYRYSVHNYSNQAATGGAEIKSSPAVVKIYGPAGLLKTYTPPTATATSGNTWVVFEISVTNGIPTIVDKNTWAMFNDTDVVTKK